MGSAFLKTLHWEESSEGPRHTFTTPSSVFKVLIKQELKTGKVGGWRRFQLDRNDSDGFQDLVKVTARRHELKPKTQKQVPKDKRPNPADSIKPTTPISHSAAFFHFSTKPPPLQKKKKTCSFVLRRPGDDRRCINLRSTQIHQRLSIPTRARPACPRTRAEGTKKREGERQKVQNRKKSQQRRGDEGSAHSTGIQLCVKDSERNEHIWRGNRIGG